MGTNERDGTDGFPTRYAAGGADVGEGIVLDASPCRTARDRRRPVRGEDPGGSAAQPAWAANSGVTRSLRGTRWQERQRGS